MAESIVTAPDGAQYRITHPDDATDEQIMERVPQSAAPQQPAPQPQVAPQQEQGSYSPMSVFGEMAAAANRGVADTADFLGPGTINAGLRLAGSDMQLPTFGGAHAQTPGAQGNFMPAGTGRDAAQGFGATVPAAGSLATVTGRNLASAGGAFSELMGFGSASPAAHVANQATDVITGARPMAARADDLGYPISPGDRTGSRTLKNIESAIESTPMPANPALAMADQRQQMMNAAAAKGLGLPKGTALTSDVVGDTADELAGEFNRLGDLESMPVSEGFLESLLKTQDTAGQRLFVDTDIGKTIDRVFDKIDDYGNLGVDDYQDMSSQLKKKVNTAWKGESPDPDYAESLAEIIDALDALAIDSVDPAARQRLKTARQRWRVLSALEKSRAIHESGDVSGPLLANYLRRTDKGGYGRGKNTGDLYETARMSKAFPSRPDSGTAGRSYFQGLLNNPVSGGIGLAASPLTTGLAQAYYKGGDLIPRAAQNLGMSPALMARGGGISQNKDDEVYDPQYNYLELELK